MSDLLNNPALLGSSGLGIPAAVPHASPPPDATATRAPGQSGAPSFADVLDAQTSASTPTFSKHALERLSRRGVEIDGQTLGRLTQGIQDAAGKGARNSVVFVDGTAFVASVQNNTVITAVTPEAMKSHVFTNIDSAVIA